LRRFAQVWRSSAFIDNKSIERFKVVKFTLHANWKIA